MLAVRQQRKQFGSCRQNSQISPPHQKPCHRKTHRKNSQSMNAISLVRKRSNPGNRLFLGLVGVLAIVLAIGNLYYRSMRVPRTKKAATQIYMSLLQYQVATGAFPSKQQGLLTLSRMSTHPGGQPLLRKIPLDGFGKPFVYEPPTAPSAYPTVRSLGEDGLYSTADDVVCDLRTFKSLAGLREPP